MEQFDKKSILEMSMGAILERVDYEMGRVLENVLDPNTKATAKRKITVGLEPTDPVTTSLFITSAPNTGEMVVAEMVPQVPGQIFMDGDEQGQPKILKFARQA